MATNKENIMSDDERKEACENYVRLKHLISCLGMRALRLLFRDRYKKTTNMEWENGSVTFNEHFIKRVGSTLDLTREQKIAFESADVNKWDLTLLVTVLLNMSTRMPKWNKLQGIAEDDEALKSLQNITNYLLEHVSGEVIPNSDYERQWQVAKEALLCLGARENDIEHFRTTLKLESPGSSLAAINKETENKSKALRSRAENLMAAGEFEEGIQLYSEALLLVGLSPKEKSLVYSSRSNWYIRQLEDHKKSLSDDVAQKYLGIAMEDANLAIQLQPKPKVWKGHFLEGKCFQLQELLDEAIDSFETALSLSPGSEQIINARDVCRLNKSDDEDLDLDALITPKGVLEEMEMREEIQRMIEINNMMMKSKDPASRAVGCVFMGQRYVNGDEVLLNKEKAAELFRKAAKIGSPDGAYYAGLCYLKGIGLKQNIPEAVKHFEAAAFQKVKTGVEHQNNNEAVARAQGALGFLIRSGVGKTRDYWKAAQWYKLAALGGNGVGAAGLAGILSAGMGMVRDTELALQFQKLAVELGSCPKDMYGLARLFAELGDLTHARYWYDRAITASYTVADSDREYFQNLNQLKQQDFEEFKKKLPAHVLNSGVSIDILYDRHFKNRNFNWSTFFNLQRNIAGLVPKSVALTLRPIGLCEDVAHPDLAELKKFASQGQEYARIMLDGVEHLLSGVETSRKLIGMDSVKDGPLGRDGPSIEMLKPVALAEIAAGYISEVAYAVYIPSDCRAKLKEIAMEFTNDREKSQSDLHARICLLSFSMDSFEDTWSFAEVCMARYPEQPHFRVLRTKFCGYLGKYEEGIKLAEEGLKLLPDNPELLFYRAWFLASTWKRHYNIAFLPKALAAYFERKESSPDKGKCYAFNCDLKCSSQIEACQTFIRKAPPGHRYIPEVYYLLAHFHAAEGNFEDFVTCYNLGEDAEKKLLSNLLPYESTSKRQAEQILKLIEEGSTRSQNAFERLLKEDPEEVKENKIMQLDNPKRLFVVRHSRNVFTSRDIQEWGRDVVGWPSGSCRTAMEGEHKQRAPSRQQIPSLKSIRFVDMDPTMDQVYEGRFMDLTIMEEYIDWVTDCINSVVKDDNDDFSFICFYNFDRSHPSTPKKLGFGSRIRLMNPYLVPLQPAGSVVRVDDPNSVVLLSSGDKNPICRYCWKPDPGPRCGKCKTAQYCNKECQQRDWDVLEHKTVCNIVSKSRKTPEIVVESLKI